MKRFVSVLAGLLVLPAFAEVAPAYYYEDVIEYAEPGTADDDATVASDVDVVDETDVAPVPAVTTANPRSATNRVGASRALPVSGAVVGAGRTVTANSRGVAARSNSVSNANVARTATGANSARTTTASGRPIANRGVSATRNARANRTNTNANVTTRGNGNNSNAVAARAAELTDSGKPLYIGTNNSSASRVGVRGASTMTAAANRASTVRIATANGVSNAVSVTETTANLDELAQLTDFCKAQYTQCMDNFCNVLDDNQGRCSCSKNVKNYEKTEQALKAATEELQDVAQKIQYIGLSGDEIEILFSQTEAELKMQNTTDNSQLKSDLDKIKKMIVEAKSGSSSTVSNDSGISLDLSNLLDFSISSTGFDLSALFGGKTSDTSSISNQRGETLYKTAAARCKAAVLTSCSNQGVDISVITNSYDLEIDKQCIAYERNLNDSNDQMTATVRNAKSVLQKARLLVAQQKNQYDMRGCINALDSCMQDDFVCGSDYENCLDPYGKYIVNGEVVIGSEPGEPGNTESISGVYAAWEYASTSTGSKYAWASSSAGGNLGEYIQEKFKGDRNTFDTSGASDMVNFLHKKIGTIDSTTGVARGMCVSVLNRCQDYSYTTKNRKSGATYNDTNDVIRGYLERVLVQIKAAQDELLSDYAESCIADVASCITSNNGTSYTLTDNANIGEWIDSVSNIAIKACQATIKTCRSVTGSHSDVSKTDRDWLKSVFNIYAYDEGRCTGTGGTWSIDGTTGTCSCKSPLTAVKEPRWNGTANTEVIIGCKCSDENKTWNASTKACE